MSLLKSPTPATRWLWGQNEPLLVATVEVVTHYRPMCYSAQLQASHAEYLRRTGAQIDIDQFAEIFGARVRDPSIRIPRAI